MKGQKGKAAREGRCPRSAAISGEKVQGRKKKIIKPLTATRESSFVRNISLLLFCRPHYATRHVQVCPLHQRKVGVESGIEEKKERVHQKKQNQTTPLHLGTLIQFGGFSEVKLFLAGPRRMKGAL